MPTPSTHEPRVVLVTKIAAGEGGPVWWFASTHLDHLEETNRLAQARWIQMIFSEKGAEPAILAGDLNAVPESRVLNLFAESWLDAAALDPQPTIPTRNPSRRIDYILFCPPNKWKPVSTQVLDEPLASDHLPVVAELEYLP